MRIMSKGGENERTECEEEVVTLDVVTEAEDVDVVLDAELDLEVVDPNTGDRILERTPGIKPGLLVVAGVAGVFLSFGGGGVGAVGGTSK